MSAFPFRQTLFRAYVLPLIFLAGSVISPAAQQPIQDDSPIRIRVDLATLKFTVQDSSGRFINHLSQEDFQIFENGVRRDIVFFDGPRSLSESPLNLWLAFLIDVSGSTFATRVEELLAARAFLENVSDNTHVGVFGFSNRLIPFQDFTRDKRRALQALSAAEGHLGGTAIYGSLETLMALMSERAGESSEKVIIVISDGLDDEFARSRRTISVAQSNGFHIYTVLVPSSSQLFIRPTGENSKPWSDPLEEEKISAFLSLSEQTRGRHFDVLETVFNFDNVLAEINDDLFGNLYTIAYYPEMSEREPSVRIELTASDAFVRGLSTRFPAPENSRKQLLAALFDDRAFEGIDFSFHLDLREIGGQVDILRPVNASSRSGVPFRLRVSPARLIDRRHHTLPSVLGVLGLLVSRDGNNVTRLREFFRPTVDGQQNRDRRSIVYRNTIMAPPGDYKLKLAVVHIPSWQISFFERDVSVSQEER